MRSEDVAFRLDRIRTGVGTDTRAWLASFEVPNAAELREQRSLPFLQVLYRPLESLQYSLCDGER